MLRSATRCLLSCGLALLIAGPALAAGNSTPLTGKVYRERCLMCHGETAPEGVGPPILHGLAAKQTETGEPVGKASKLIGVCWRRCEKCWPER